MFFHVPCGEDKRGISVSISFFKTWRMARYLLYSLVAVAAITIVASVVLGGLDLSSANVFQLKDSVRL